MPTHYNKIAGQSVERLFADVLRAARALAAEEGLSVTALIAASLAEVVRRRKRYHRARKRAVARLRKGLNLGWTPFPSRDELHAR
jgi:hypothetical protein